MSAEADPISSESHILVPVDFSNHSRLALKAAGGMMADRHGRRLTLLSVVEPPTSGLRIQTADLHKQMMHEAEMQLREWVRAELPELEGVNVAVVSGFPGEEICEQAAKRGVDMIVISTHGHTGLKRYLLGSVAEKVVRHAHCSVLVVR